MIASAQSLKDRASKLWYLEDDSFQTAFDMVRMVIRITSRSRLNVGSQLEHKPRIGLDKGWRPRDQDESSLGADIEFKVFGVYCSSDYEPLIIRQVVTLICCQDVDFRFEGMRNHLLKGISFRIKAGSFVGICGERGAGKSTLFKLIMRLYDPNNGEIQVGGHPLEYYNPVWLRSQVRPPICSV